LRICLISILNAIKALTGNLSTMPKIWQARCQAVLLNTFAVNNLINESHKLKHRILFEDIPLGQQYLTTIIEAMRDGLKLRLSYQSYGMDKPAEFDIEPCFVKVFKPRINVIGKSDLLLIYSLERMVSLTSTSKKFNIWLILILKVISVIAIYHS